MIHFLPQTFIEFWLLIRFDCFSKFCPLNKRCAYFVIKRYCFDIRYLNFDFLENDENNEKTQKKRLYEWNGIADCKSKWHLIYWVNFFLLIPFISGENQELDVSFSSTLLFNSHPFPSTSIAIATSCTAYMFCHILSHMQSLQMINKVKF